MTKQELDYCFSHLRTLPEQQKDRYLFILSKLLKIQYDDVKDAYLSIEWANEDCKNSEELFNSLCEQWGLK